MKSIKKMTDDVIDIVHEETYSEIEEWDEEDGHHVEVNLSPKPDCYEKLNQYFIKTLKDRVVFKAFPDKPKLEVISNEAESFKEVKKK